MAMAKSALRAVSEPADPPGGLKRIGLLLALVAVGLLMLRDSLAYVVRPVDPALALRINPDNAEVAASRAEQLLRDDPANRAAAEALARRALRRSPVSAAAARMIATARDVAGDPAAARRLMAYSESLSLRDLPTQVWLIQDAVQHNDVMGALHHYDVALRSSEASKPLLFPVLIKALDQPAVVAGLVGTLAAQPEWAGGFLDRAAREAPDLDGLAALIRGLALHGYKVPKAVTAQASARMVDARRYDTAWQVYAVSDVHAARGTIRDPDFVRFGMAEGPFAWTMISGNGLMAEPRGSGGHSVLAYRAMTGTGGVIARQLLMLQAGDFRLSGAAPERTSDAPPPVVRLTCASSGQVVATISANASTFAGPVIVPAACPAQWLEIVVDGGDNPLGSSGAVGELHISPARERR
jgi:hypothetical protein